MTKLEAYQYRNEMKASCAEQGLGPECLELFDDGCLGTSITYSASMLCQENALDGAADYDYVVFNCGHHPASQHHYTYDRYKESVRKMLRAPEVEKAKDNSKTSFFWLENTAQPLRQDYWVIEKEDWRTYQR